MVPHISVPAAHQIQVSLLSVPGVQVHVAAFFLVRIPLLRNPRKQRTVHGIESTASGGHQGDRTNEGSLYLTSTAYSMGARTMGPSVLRVAVVLWCCGAVVLCRFDGAAAVIPQLHTELSVSLRISIGCSVDSSKWSLPSRQAL